MKKYILLAFIIILTQNFSFSQIDFKGGLYVSSPFGFFASGEYGVYDDIGIEVGVISNPGLNLGQTHISGTAITINVRYYFSPKYGLDRFYTGLYMRPHTTLIKEEITNFFFPTFPATPTSTSSTFEYSRDSGVGVGFLLGKKFVSKSNFSVDFNIGIGRNIGKRVYDLETRPPSIIGGGRGSRQRVGLDFLYSLVIGYRL